jgi:Resolvase, N terminal domain
MTSPASQREGRRKPPAWCLAGSVRVLSKDFHGSGRSLGTHQAIWADPPGRALRVVNRTILRRPDGPRSGFPAGRLHPGVLRQAVGQDRRPAELAGCLDYLRAGDTLVVPSLDRLSRPLQDLITIVAGLCRRRVGFRSQHEALNTTTSGGRLVFHVFAALAEFIRELIVEGTREGLDAARARGQRLGRPPAMTGADPPGPRPAHLPINSISSIARLLGVSRSTIYKFLPELADGYREAAAQIPPPPGPGGRSGWPSRRRRQPARMPDPLWRVWGSPKAIGLRSSWASAQNSSSPCSRSGGSGLCMYPCSRLSPPRPWLCGSGRQV